MDRAAPEEKFFTARISRHLLFNSLNSAIVLCRREPEEASELLNSLSQCLIYTSEQQTNSLVPLSAELGFIRSYLHIQAVRFGRRLQVVFNIQETKGLLPPQTLQPLVDNVFKHVMLYTREKVTLTVESVRGESGIVVTVRDNRVGMGEEQLENLLQKRQGHSLDRINTALLNNKLPGLAITSRKGRGTSVSVWVKH